MLAFLLPVALAAAPAQTNAALTQLVHDFVEAERAFDQKRLSGLITTDYAEVSPLGELDLHDAFLGFYAADKKSPVPATTIGTPLMRYYGQTASIITRLSFSVPTGAGQPPREVGLRASFLAVRQGGGWKLASAHYTPERPKAPPVAR